MRRGLRRGARRQQQVEGSLDGGGHANHLGNYLQSCSVYAALTGKSPVGLPADLAPKKGLLEECGCDGSEYKKNNAHMHKLSKEEIDFLQKKAWEAHQAGSNLLAGDGKEAKNPGSEKK